MGRKTATETLAKTLAALLSKRTVVQAALARSISVDSETVARAMRELAEGGVPVVRAVVGRDVEWSVGKNWFPNAVMFERDEATRLLLLLLRLRPSRERDAFVSKLAAAACAPKGSERAERVAIPATTNPPEAEACRLAVEDAVLKRAVIALKYQRSGDTEPTWRTVSPQSTVSADRPYLVALDHSKNELRNYRFDRMHRVMTEERVAFREVPRDDVERHVRESMHGFRGGELREVSFVFNDRAWATAKDNLPFDCESQEKVEDGVRVVVKTRAGAVFVRFLLAHGTNVRIETDAVREEVLGLARAVIDWHSTQKPGEKR